MTKFTIEEKWTVLHMLSFLTMFLSDYIINEKLWENFMDAILYNTHSIPMGEVKGYMYSTQRGKQGKAMNLGQDLAAARKTLNTKAQICPPAMFWLKV